MAPASGGFEFDFYGLRHTFATLSLQAGVHVKTVSKQLGPNSITITLDRYARVLDEMQVEAASKVDEFLGVATQMVASAVANNCIFIR